jgi:hypothetical protein
MNTTSTGRKRERRRRRMHDEQQLLYILAGIAYLGLLLIGGIAAVVSIAALAKVKSEQILKQYEEE